MIPHNDGYAALKIELDAGHPDTGPYDADEFIAFDQIELVNRTIDRPTIPAAEIFDEILKQPAEWGAVADSDRQLVLEILRLYPNVPTVDGNPARTQLIAALGTVTKAAIAAMIPITVSRTTELGYSKMKVGDIQNARALA